jgi:bacterioferritin-associated ferredoxin
MIVCSCNVFSDHQVRSVVAKEAWRPRMSEVDACLGCGAQCGRCMSRPLTPLSPRQRDFSFFAWGRLPAVPRQSL